MTSIVTNESNPVWWSIIDGIEGCIKELKIKGVRNFKLGTPRRSESFSTLPTVYCCGSPGQHNSKPVSKCILNPLLKSSACSKLSDEWHAPRFPSIPGTSSICWSNCSQLPPSSLQPVYSWFASKYLFRTESSEFFSHIAIFHQIWADHFSSFEPWQIWILWWDWTQRRQACDLVLKNRRRGVYTLKADFILDHFKN